MKKDLPEEALIVLIYSYVDIIGGGFFYTEVASAELIPAISLKRFPSQKLTWLLDGSTFKLSRNFLRDIFAKHFLTKSQASNLY